MPFVKGQKKTGGRPKGQPNKKTDHFFELCQKHGHDPVEFNIMLAKNDWQALGYPSRTYSIFTKSGDSYEQDYIGISDRITANNKLLDFMYPKRKAIEITNPEGEQNNAILVAYNPAMLKEVKE